MPRRQQFSAQSNQSVCNLAKAAMPLQKQVSQLSESEGEHESGPEVDLFEIWVEIIKPGLRQSQAHPCVGVFMLQYLLLELFLRCS